MKDQLMVFSDMNDCIDYIGEDAGHKLLLVPHSSHGVKVLEILHTYGWKVSLMQLRAFSEGGDGETDLTIRSTQDKYFLDKLRGMVYDKAAMLHVGGLLPLWYYGIDRYLRVEPRFKQEYLGQPVE